MKIQGEYSFEAPVAAVWSALLDPVVLAAVMPGCEKLDLVDGHYVGDLNIKVGPVQGKFSGKVDLSDVVEPKSFTMTIDGKGVPGFVKAKALVKLEPDGEKTKIHYDADAQVGGKIASVGQRLIEATSRAITKQCLDGLHENIKLRVAAKAAEPAKAEEPAPAAEPPAEPEKPAALAAEPAEKPAEPVKVVRVEQSALAAAVAKEAAKSMLPSPLVIGVIALAVGGVVWLLIR